MATIVTRAGKTEPLTHAEVDANFVNLNTDKIESGDSVPSLDINGGTIDGTVIGATTPAAISGTTGSFSGNLTVDTNTLFVDAANNRVGVGTVSPTASLDVARSGSHTVLIRTVSTGDPTLNLQADGQNSGQISYSRSGEALTFSNSGSERLRITSTGNVGIGTSSPGFPLEVLKTGVDSTIWGFNVAQLADSTANVTGLRIGTSTSVAGLTNIVAATNSAPSQLAFWNYNGSAWGERARIDSSGNLLVGTTTQGGHGLVTGIEVQSVSGTNLVLVNTNSTGTPVRFITSSSTLAGTITTSGSSTAYNTSSDYRLKEDVQPMSGASDRVLLLKPVNFAWKADGTRVDGFLAHEAQAVVPEAVTGEKDGEEMQAIDQSKLVPLLTAALQEALQKIEALEARITALEA